MQEAGIPPLEDTGNRMFRRSRVYTSGGSAARGCRQLEVPQLEDPSKLEVAPLRNAGCWSPPLENAGNWRFRSSRMLAAGGSATRGCRLLESARGYWPLEVPPFGLAMREMPLPHSLGPPLGRRGSTAAMQQGGAYSDVGSVHLPDLEGMADCGWPAAAGLVGCGTPPPRPLLLGGSRRTAECARVVRAGPAGLNWPGLPSICFGPFQRTPAFPKNKPLGVSVFLESHPPLEWCATTDEGECQPEN
eukprot:gene16440-biopygen20284